MTNHERLVPEKPVSFWAVPLTVLIAGLAAQIVLTLAPRLSGGAAVSHGWLLVAATVLVGSGMIFALARLNTLVAAGISAAALLVAAVAAFKLANTNAAGRFAPLVVIGAVAIAAAVMHLVFATERRRRLGRAFWGALPLNAVAAIARKPSLLRLPGSNRTVTCLSLAMQDFEILSLSFRHEPASFTGLMQRLLPRMMEEALFHGGMVERVSGEGFMAVWNAPLDDEAHAMHACEAAIRMSERRSVLASERGATPSVPAQPPTPEVAIAIATGEAIAGGFMAQGRASYTVSGACAILAERLAALRPRYGSAILVSEATRDACEKEFAFLEVDCVTLEGFAKPIRLYAMLGDSRMRGSPTFRALSTFHEHIFRTLQARQWQKARALVEQCRKLSGANQTLYDFYLTRIAALEADPPQADWDGAFRAA